MEIAFLMNLKGMELNFLNKLWKQEDLLDYAF